MKEELPEITNIVFNKTPDEIGSFVGYVGFTIDKLFIFSELSLHKRKDAKNKYRVVYPENKFRKAYMRPKSKEVQEYIDDEISFYINVQLGIK